MKLLVLAAPRSGTGYLAAVLQRLGVRVGHETVYTPGRVLEHLAGGPPPTEEGHLPHPAQRVVEKVDVEISWLAAPSVALFCPPGVRLAWQVRRPRLVLESYLGTDHLHRGPDHVYDQVAFAADPGLAEIEGREERCARHLLAWSRRVLGIRCDYIYRVEDLWARRLVQILRMADIDRSEGECHEALSSVPTDTNHRARSPFDIYRCEWPTEAELISLAASLGYSW
jgi:hypothetical protein